MTNERTFFSKVNLSVQQKLSLHFHNLDFKSTKNKDDETEDELIKKYTKSDQIKKIRESVSKRLGLKERLKLKELKGLYQMCAFDYMLYNGKLIKLIFNFSGQN